MKIVIGLLVLVLITLILGPIFGAIAVTILLLFLVPGVGGLVGLVVIYYVVTENFTVNQIMLFVVFALAVLAFVYFFADKIIDRQAEKKKQATMLERVKIEGTDLWQDQNGQKWKKVAGIYKEVDET